MPTTPADQRLTRVQYVAKARRDQRQRAQRLALRKPSLFAALRLRPPVPSRPRF